MSWTRIQAIITKELRDYRRNRFIVSTMVIMPAFFLVIPIIEIFVLPASAAEAFRVALLGMLIIPTIVPVALAAYSVVGEREQGTLEPVLTTPIHRGEFLLGKGLAALVPTLLVAYGVFGAFLAMTELFADPAVAAVAFRSTALLVQLLFTPLLAGWSIWACIAISARSSDVRVAQQLGALASMPPLAMAVLMSFRVIRATPTLAVGLAVVLLLVDTLGWRLVAVLFDRERLITGTGSS